MNYIALKLNKPDPELELILELMGLESEIYEMKETDSIYVCIPDRTFGYVDHWFGCAYSLVCKTKEDFIKEIDSVLRHIKQ